ncbi:hypothetical protein A2311_03415 [candidate division WOR-1 bacterium RIFOXYB2_FULL_48_7]|uniref:Uncharacterized protein n=1 Tax=candidate division WOR-1 bacterium RIFOXYB2_FULL_48_7 TaxID=1802583 RepID=A0A1F4TS34_UNCSA|nr:MAG: hypothetical protein A2311_03415 [candidate division WOR-1 bacterium RIFOXYB2_FULL_48_7]
MDIPSSIEKSLKGSVKYLSFLQLLGGLSALLFGAGLMSISFIDIGQNAGTNIFLRIMGTGLFLLLVGIYFETRSKQKKWSAVLQALKYRPQDIVWVYQQVNKAGMYVASLPMSDIKLGTINLVYVYLQNGQHELFNLPAGQAEEVMSFFRTYFPAISLGYEPELAALYKKNPLTLVKQPRRSDKIKEVIVRGPILWRTWLGI